jgi:hypothetical protein
MAGQTPLDLNIPVACSNMVTELKTKNQGGDLMSKHQLIDAVLSDVNRQGFQVETSVPFGNNVDGNNCTFKVRYKLPRCTPKDSKPLCEETPSAIQSHYGNLDLKLHPTPFVCTGLLNDHILKCACDSNAKMFADEIDAAMRMIKDQVANWLVECYLDCLSNYCDTTDPLTSLKVLNIMKPDGTVNPSAFAAIANEFYKMSAEGSPLIVGDSQLAIYDYIWKAVGSGINTAPNAGVGSAIPGTSFFGLDQSIDNVTNSILGTSGKSFLFAFAPGTIQMFNYNKYDPNRAVRRANTATNATSVVTKYGLTFDLKVYYDEKCENNMYELRYHPGFFCIPKGAYCDPNKTMKLLYEVNCGEPTCITSCVTPVAPVAPKVETKKEAAPKAKE